MHVHKFAFQKKIRKMENQCRADRKPTIGNACRLLKNMVKRSLTLFAGMNQYTSSI
ncbi:MAG TPA: hypothetical protein VK133_02745 [Amoebophilaceae bacterium]|jgi:hypothetical protein|nr:hypothetical protein [Amoebophilaceae bacterium]